MKENYIKLPKFNIIWNQVSQSFHYQSYFVFQTKIRNKEKWEAEGFPNTTK